MSGEVIILRQHAIKIYFITDFNEHALFFIIRFEHKKKTFLRFHINYIKLIKYRVEEFIEI